MSRDVQNIRPRRKASVGVRAAVELLQPEGGEAPVGGRLAGENVGGQYDENDIKAEISKEGSGENIPTGGSGEGNEDEAAVDAIATDAFTEVAALPQVVPQTRVIQNTDKEQPTVKEPSAARPGCKLVWTEEEDEIMRAMVKKFGEGRWSLLAEAVKTKNAKQCRRRWKNHLAINAKHTDWNTEEDNRLIAYHQRLGNKWTAISKEFGDRTDNACKNRWHALVKKRPELKELKVPLSGVGVRKGTKTHSLILEGDSLSLGTDPSIGMPHSKVNITGPQQVALPATPFDAPSANLGQNQPQQPATAQEYLAQLLGNGSLQNFLGSQQISSLPQPSALAGLGTINVGQVLGAQLPTMMNERNAQALYTMISQKMTDVGMSGLPSMEFSDSFQKNLGSLLLGHPGGGTEGEPGTANGDADVNQSDAKNAMSAQTLQQLLSFNVAGMLAAGGAGGGGQAAANKGADVDNEAGTKPGNMTGLDSQQLLDVTFTNPGSLDPGEKIVLDNLLSPGDAGTKRKREGQAGGDTMAPTQSNFYREWGKVAEKAAEGNGDKRPKKADN